MAARDVLLSFAQFEREVTGERIRDKIAASKARGMWMGGVVPLGYEVDNRSLAVNEPEAAHVRTLFERYLALGSADAVVAHARAHGITSKRHHGMTGIHRGGTSLSRDSLYRILANPLYAGDVGHAGMRYLGQHEAIVSRETWDAVQALLAAQRRKPRGGNDAPRLKTPPPATISSQASSTEDGIALRPTHTRQGSRRCDYYVGAGLRIAATRLDRLVADTVMAEFDDPARLAGHLLVGGGITPERLRQGQRIACLFESLTAEADPDPARAALHRITVDGATLVIALAPDALGTDAPVTIATPAAIGRRDDTLALVLPPATASAAGRTPDLTLVTAVAQARGLFAELASGAAASIEAIAARDGVSPGHVGTLLPAAFLAPDIVAAIATGRRPASLTGKSLMNALRCQKNGTNRRDC